MKRNQRIFIILNWIGIMVHTCSMAQTSINSASHRLELQGASHEYSIGEMVLVSTIQSPSLIVTQGYYQPDDSKAESQDQAIGLEEDKWVNAISIFPNPTLSFLYIQCIESSVGSLNYSLIDASGKLLKQQDKLNLNAGEILELDMQSFASGVYYVLLEWKDQKGESHKLSYKISKQG